MGGYLLDCILEQGKSTLLDSNWIGNHRHSLSDHFEEVIGIEIQPEAIERAKRNAERNNVRGQWFAGKVEEALPEVQAGADSTILLDPPREGLHPKACQFFASQEADCLVYVACNPKSLERDRAILESGNWTMTDLWMVDMFPQTPHVECVGKFIYTLAGVSMRPIMAHQRTLGIHWNDRGLLTAITLWPTVH